MKEESADYGRKWGFKKSYNGKNKIKMAKKGKMLNKQAQMKIQQMSFLLLAVFIFFALVGMFLLKIKVTGITDTATTLQENNAMLLVTKLANSPEFSCEFAYGTEKTDCIDADKVMVLKENIEKYSGFWGVTNIEIRKIYPKNRNITCTSTNYPNCDTINLFDKPISGNDKSNFVAWCRKEKYNDEIQNSCELARISVSYEEVNLK
jgi:hypothetical protein